MSSIPFSVKNFTNVGNELFNGSGERTDYVNNQINDNTGFTLIRDVNILCTTTTHQILSGSKIHITKPGVLVRGDAIGGKSRSIYVKIGINSPNEADYIGYAPIISIQKPSNKGQSRLSCGSNAQLNVVNHLKQTFGNMQVQSIAKIGSTKADLVVDMGGSTVQFEVKGTSNTRAPITLFDKSMKRGKRNHVLDSAARVISQNAVTCFSDLVDMHRRRDKTIGFPGDVGVYKSGRLPKGLELTDTTTLNDIRQSIIEHFHENADNYFAVNDYNNGTVNVFWTGYGDNVLESPMFPELKKFTMRTYGGPSAGSMRVGVKVVL